MLQNPPGHKKGSGTVAILVSACLLGEKCKYNGGDNYCPAVIAYVKDQNVIPVCPEMRAGMGCPRIPIEIANGVLIDQNGKNVDATMRTAIAEIMADIKDEEVTCAILKSRSPTCGVRQVYDGTFSGKLVSGSGLFAQALKDAGYQVIDSEEIQ